MIACFDFTFALSRLSVPRMPGFRFVHVGHTLQLGKTDAKIYWLHYGDSDLGYRRIPFEWSGKLICLYFYSWCFPFLVLFIDNHWYLTF